MKNLILIFVVFLSAFVYGQKQIKPDWPSLANSPWPVLRGDMQGTGRSEYVGPHSYNVKWVKDMPFGIIKGPLIGYNDVLYMGARAFNSDPVNYFYAVGKNSENIWTYKTSEPDNNSNGLLLTSDTSVYFVSASRGLYSLNKNGELKWEIYSAADKYIQYGIDKKGNLYISGQDSLRIISPSGDMNKIYFPKISSSLSFSFGGDTIFTVTGGPMNQSLSGAMTATDLYGNVYWSYNLGGVGWGLPVVDNQNNVYFYGADTLFGWTSYLYCLKSDGTLKWKYPTRSFEEYNAPTIDHNGNIIFMANSYNSKSALIVSLDYGGNTRWVDTLQEDYGSSIMDFGMVCDAEGKIYFGSAEPKGYFYCIDSNGVILWKTLIPTNYDSCPAIGSDGTLYLGFHNGSLYRINVRNLIAINDTVTSVANEIGPAKDYQLYQNYPNPFNPSTIIKYQIPKPGLVTLKVYDVLGKEVANLVNEYQNTGRYNVNFDASKLASGVYIYQIVSKDYVSNKKMMLLK